MALYSSLATKGSTNFIPYTPTLEEFKNRYATPQTKALSNASTVTHPTSSAPVKKQTTVSPNGSTVTTEYHAPTAPVSSSGSYASPDTSSETNSKKETEMETPTPTFSGLVGTLANPSQGEYNKLAMSTLKGLIERAEQNRELARRADEIATAAGQKISDIGGQGARASAGYLTTGTSPVAEGNAAVQAQTTAAQQQAVAEGAGAQLQGINIGLTAQEQEQNAIRDAISNALTGQGQNQSAVGTAAGLAQPTFQGYGSGEYRSPLETPGTGGQYGTGPAAAANVQSIKDLTALSNKLQSTFNGVDANFNLLLNTAREGGVNNNDVPALNLIQQNVQKGLASDQAVINFRNTLAAVRAGYAEILGGGTATVDSQHRAEEAIPENISLNALMSLGEQLKSEATNRIQGINQQINTIQGPQSQATSGGTSWDDL